MVSIVEIWYSKTCSPSKIYNLILTKVTWSILFVFCLCFPFLLFFYNKIALRTPHLHLLRCGYVKWRGQMQEQKLSVTGCNLWWETDKVMMTPWPHSVRDPMGQREFFPLWNWSLELLWPLQGAKKNALWAFGDGKVRIPIIFQLSLLPLPSVPSGRMVQEVSVKVTYRRVLWKIPMEFALVSHRLTLSL